MISNILVALSIFILTILAVFFDEPLSAEARATLAMVPDRTTHRAVLYRAGLNAPENLDPFIYGQYMLWGSSSSGTTSHPGALQAIESQGLRSPRGPFFCSLYEDSGCWSQISAINTETLTALEKDHATLLNRYQTWLKISDAKNETIGLTPENSVPVEHLSGAHRLVVLRAFHDAAQGQAMASSERLQTTIMDLRQHFTLADDFPAKLIVADLIDESLQVASVISQTHQVKIPSISPLTAQEKDLSVAMAQQFRKVSHFFLSIDGINFSRPPPQENSLAWAVRSLAMQRLVYKPKQTSNRAHEALRFWVKASRASPADFIRLMSQEIHDNNFKQAWDQWRNPLGHIVGQLAEPRFKLSIIRLQQLDITILMFNVTQEQPIDKLSSKALANPYGQGAPATLSANRSALCMPSPDLIHSEATCLRLAV